ncbi:MAG: 50S ribosomal protein L20 [Rickettsiaceae bacterium]|nr:50S ribosomal protein L20 [Rickettsiaceae bacterium]
MTRAKLATSTTNKHKKILKLAKGYRGRANNCYRVGIEKVEKALRYAYRDRRNKKRDFRALWIQRINAAVREHGLVYSKFISELIKLGINIDRKLLAELAVNNSEAFAHLVDKVRKQESVKLVEEASINTSDKVSKRVKA